MKKKALLFLLFMVSCFCMKAQYSIGVEAGYLNNYITTDLRSKSKNSFKAGLICNYIYKDILVLGSGISFQRKGGIISGDMKVNHFYKLELVNMDYLILPLTIGYKVQITNNLSITPKSGIYAGCGIGGHGYFHQKLYDQDQEYKIQKISVFSTPKPVSNYSAISRLDYGIGIGLDITLAQFQFKAAYDWGLQYIGTYGGDMKNRTLSITVGYYYL